jgi:hypothetical protein
MVPATPMPITAVRAGSTPAAPPASTPEPRDSQKAPTMAAARPAISLMGASSGSPLRSVTVSNA